MKKIIIFIYISTFFTLSSYSQINKENRKKIRALKIAYITEQLNLNTDEAEKFWPVYNSFSKTQMKLRNTLRKTLKNSKKESELTEDEAKKLVELKLNTDKQLYESQKSFIDKIQLIIPYKKIVKLQVAEMEFGRKLMQKYRKNRPNFKE